MPREWDRQEGETPAAFAAFAVYLHLDDRSLAKAAKKQAENSGKTAVKLRQFETWSTKYEWVQRASAYEAHIYNEAQVQLEADQIARKKELLARDAELADQLYDRVQDMLKFPLMTKETTRTAEKNGVEFEQHVTFSPARWNYNNLRLLAETASALGRRALEMPTDTQRLELTGPDGQPLGKEDPQAVLENMSTLDIAAEYQKRVRNKPPN